MKQTLKTLILCSLVNSVAVCKQTRKTIINKTIPMVTLLMNLINMMDSISVEAVKLVNLRFNPVVEIPIVL